MTYAELNRRVTRIETRTREVEACHSESIYKLTRRAARTDIVTGRLVVGMNQLGRGIALMMERMGLPPLEFAEVSMPTEAEIDDALEADC
ncbi:hypothetical protein APR12_004339 [Nocardia amikacinitolerans]|uniref:hypothetical protein n=1 Tax=Nocardia amikacinitolerans TaxID=756689 RepID=UPI000835AF91|nr:hypothetical protein [Nocardia amikacinitolerans]MCP2318976.1 hypothetical protein [Nocardia amikacinitolerans]